MVDKNACKIKKEQHISPPSDVQAPNQTSKIELSLNTIPENSIPDSDLNVNTHAKIFPRVIQNGKKGKTGVISDTMLGTQASTRLLPVSNIRVPQLIQKINPKDINF